MARVIGGWSGRRGNGGRKRTTWPKGGPRPAGVRNPGRPKGAKDKVPRGLRASVVRICEGLVKDDPAMIRRALLKGLRARPPASFAYLQLAAHYLDGKPAERVVLDGAIRVVQSQRAAAFKAEIERLALAVVVREGAPPALGGNGGPPEPNRIGDRAREEGA